MFFDTVLASLFLTRLCIYVLCIIWISSAIRLCKMYRNERIRNVLKSQTNVTVLTKKNRLRFFKKRCKHFPDLAQEEFSRLGTTMIMTLFTCQMSAHFLEILTSPFPLVCRSQLLVDFPLLPVQCVHTLMIKTKRKIHKNINIIYKFLDC